MKTIAIATAVIAALAVAKPSWATTDIEVWHMLRGVHQTEFESLVKQFNRAQKDVKVSLKAYENLQALRNAKPTQGATRPHLVQLADNHTPEVIAEHRDILPLYRLLANHPIKNLTWFLPQTTHFVRDDRGRLLAFPFMAEIPVMFYNTDAYHKAGLDLSRPSRTWNDLQGDLIKLRSAGALCPYATSQQVMVHFENLAAVNRKPYAVPNNGLGAGKSTLQFDVLAMRHLALMASWKRSLLLTHHSREAQASALFAQGDCAVLTAGSGALGEMLHNKALKFAVAPLPYYPQASKEEGTPFVSGSALWAIAGHSKAENQATAAFLAYLSTPAVAAAWHQKTGFLPLSQAAFNASDSAYYDRIPGAHKLINAMRNAPQTTSRGFRLPNYTVVAPVLDQGFEAALDGQLSPMTALNEAQARSAQLMANRR